MSATHEEYREAKQRCDVLVFIQGDVELEREEDEFVREVQDWNAGQYTESFQTPEELRDLLIRRLHELELAASWPWGGRLDYNSYSFRTRHGECRRVSRVADLTVYSPSFSPETSLSASTTLR